MGEVGYDDATQTGTIVYGSPSDFRYAAKGDLKAAKPAEKVEKDYGWLQGLSKDPQDWPDRPFGAATTEEKGR